MLKCCMQYSTECVLGSYHLRVVG